ncbi:MAG: DUF3786 domain-containing protein [Desulfosalsimonas sp.]
MNRNPVFDETYRKYLAELSGVDIKRRAEVLGASCEDDTAVVPFFSKNYRVSAKGIFSPHGTRPIHSVSVVLLKYFILCPQDIPSDDSWVSYRDFIDAAPFAGAFAVNTEHAIAQNFCGDAEGLKKACLRLGGISPDQELPYDLAMKVYALPRIPLLLLFNDRDEEFESSCSVLFEKRAKEFLDMECLAIVGWLFSDYLQAGAAAVKNRGRRDPGAIIF